MGHASGGYITSTASCVPAKTDAQGIGAATTYLRRYSAAAAAGIAQEDDDGTAAAHDRKPEPVYTGRPMDGVWDHFNEEEAAFLRKLASDIEGIIKADGPAQAADHLKAQQLTSEEKTAVWSVLTSATRTALKKAAA